MHDLAGVDVSPAWRESVDRILARQWRKVLVIGATDRGKSTYCAVLLRGLRSAGFRAAFVDADIGQKDVGPPATISLAYPEAEGGLAGARLAGVYFVGAVAPQGHLLPITVGTRVLVDAAQAAFVVIDTTGLIQGPGRVLTGFQIESLRPDAIVAIGRGAELAPLLRAYRHCNVIALRPSPAAAPKSREERRVVRERAFRAYFEGACETVLDLRRLSVQRTLLFNGQPFADPRFVYTEQTPEGIIAVAEAPCSAQAADVRMLPAGFERNLLCGLADRQGRGLGLAIVRAIDFKRQTVALLSPVPAAPIRVLQFGELYLDADGRELGRRPPGTF